MKSYGKRVARYGLIGMMFVLVLSIFSIDPISGWAVYSCGGDSDTCNCGGNNPYPCSINRLGNCTWLAWEKACCVWGIALPNWGNAIDWYDKAKQAGYSVGRVPVPNSIFVAHWIGTINNIKRDYGHVGWVTSVDPNGEFNTVEQAWGGWSGTPHGTREFSGSTINKLRSTGTEVIGFIYKEPPEKHLVSTDGSTIYWLQNNRIYHVTDADMLNEMQDAGIPGWGWQLVITVSNLSQYTIGPDLITTSSSSDNLLIRQINTQEVYVMENGKRRWINDENCFNQHGYSFADVIDVSQSVMDSIPEGSSLCGVNVQKPDLTISETLPKTSFQSGEQVQISVTVHRSGGSITKGSYVHAALYWSTDSRWDRNDQRLWQSNDSNPDFPNSTLNSQGSKSVIATITIPNNASSGTYYIIAYADAPTSSYPNGYCDESNEENNTVVNSVSVTNRPPNTPSTPSGLSSGYTNTTYSFSTSATDPDGDSVSYRFDWGDGHTSSWGSSSQSHSWSSTRTFCVKAQAKDIHGATSGWSGCHNIKISHQDRPPNTPSTPSGPTSGYTGKSYSFSTSATDPDGDSVSYKFDWGDGHTSSWGSSTQSHRWSSTGNFCVKAQAKDSHGEMSHWSSCRNINIKTTGSLSVTPSTGFVSSGYQGGPFSPLSKTYTLQNTGGDSINWKASKGASWVTLSKTSGTLAAGASTTVKVSINSSANNLGRGTHSDTVTFTNVTNGKGNTTRSVTLNIATQYTLSVTVNGHGYVSSSPPGINCGSDCSETYSAGTAVTLTATSESGYTFTGWGGDCSSCGSNTNCRVIMDSDKSCSATFNQPPQPPVIDSFTPNHPNPNVGDTVTFTCQAHDPDGTIVSYKWDFDGDGRVDRTTTDGSTSYTYSNAGTYHVTVTVVDDSGAKTTSEPVTITVGPPSTIPGDCNGDGTVSIDEIQKSINCYLSLENACCDKCDLNSDGTVSINEVQRVINAYLGK